MSSVTCRLTYTAVSCRSRAALGVQAEQQARIERLGANHLILRRGRRQWQVGRKSSSQTECFLHAWEQGETCGRESHPPWSCGHGTCCKSAVYQAGGSGCLADGGKTSLLHMAEIPPIPRCSLLDFRCGLEGGGRDGETVPVRGGAKAGATGCTTQDPKVWDAQSGRPVAVVVSCLAIRDRGFFACAGYVTTKRLMPTSRFW
jgi:hypothetical protein